MAKPKKRQKPKKSKKHQKRGRPKQRIKLKKRQKRRKPANRRRKPPTALAITRAGMTLPVSMQLAGTTPAELAKTWQKKLAQSGWEDIEWSDGVAGSKGVNSPYLKRMDSDRMKYAKVASYDFYRLCTCYLMHNKGWCSSGDRLIWQGFTDGISYRQIAANVKKRYKRSWGTSLFYVYSRVQFMIPRMYAWHKEHPEGLLNGRDDFYADEVLLAEPDPVLRAD